MRAAPAPAASRGTGQQNSWSFGWTTYLIFRPLVARRSTSARALFLRLRAAARKRKKSARADVDRRATKGRKIKYVVHPKLQEFCCPVPRDAAGAGAARITDELFASLFGGGGSR